MEKNKLDTAERADMEAMEAQAGAEGGEDTEPEDLVLRFGKPYKFGGQEYTEVDLSGLEDVTAGVLENVGKIAAKKNPGMNPALQEMSLTFCTYLAQRVAKLPLEFFEKLPAREAIKLKALVTNFLYGGDGED
ncbi:phage tail assembly protein [Oscillospiraceae bacterium 50-60]